MVPPMFEAQRQAQAWATEVAASGDRAGLADVFFREPPASRFEALATYVAFLSARGEVERARALRDGVELARLAREERARLMPQIARRARVPRSLPVFDALVHVPRERFVPLSAIKESVEDGPVLFGDGRRSTVSAMHAYAMLFALAGIEAGQGVLDLGAGSGYGTALLSELVGPHGWIRSVEIDPALVAIADRELAALRVPSRLELHAGDALDARFFTPDLDRVVVGFALPQLPAALGRLRRGAVVVAPVVVGAENQRIARITAGDPPRIEWHDFVRFVPTQSAPP